jgi:hypothetical protein
MKKKTICVAIVLASALPSWALADAPARQARVAERGKDIMPFSLKATTHIFSKTAVGGVQRVVVKHATDNAQVSLVRSHLQSIRQQFLNGDFSSPSHIHGADMPGLHELRSAKPGQITIVYRDVDGGAELEYRTSSRVLVAALHKWFDAQVADHGADAMAGHHHQHGDIRKIDDRRPFICNTAGVIAAGIAGVQTNTG